MKERQRWTAEEDAILRAYVKQYGPREWHLVSQRMNAPLDRDSKSCLERWKNYLKPGIKKGSLTEEEQRLVIRLQAKHGNKWKKIAAEVPGRTAKRLGKWWEVYKEKQERAKKESSKCLEPIEGKYDRILESFAEKLVKERAPVLDPSTFLMGPTTNGDFLHTENVPPPVPTTTAMLPPWLSSSNNGGGPSPSSPSVTLTLSSSAAAPPPPGPPPSVPWLQHERGSHPTQTPTPTPLSLGCLPSSCHGGILPPPFGGEQQQQQQQQTLIMSELIECCRELEEGHRALAAHKKEAAWRLKSLERQLESEKANRKREKMDEIEAKIKALREEQRVGIERIEAEYREQLVGLRRDAEAKEQKLAEQWAAKHMRLTKFLEQMGCRPRFPDPN